MKQTAYLLATESDAYISFDWFKSKKLAESLYEGDHGQTLETIHYTGELHVTFSDGDYKTCCLCNKTLQETSETNLGIVCCDCFDELEEEKEIFEACTTGKERAKFLLEQPKEVQLGFKVDTLTPYEGVNIRLGFEWCGTHIERMEGESDADAIARCDEWLKGASDET